MSDIAIRVEGLSKQYRLGEREPYKSIRDVIMRAAKKPLKWLKNDGSISKNEDQYFWALDDVSFEVKRGEALGIIGPNGAGKSTLLKILSGITKPTRGYADIYGRVGSLLEVGTGFHPELTGRENIYLNGAVLGMRRYEIDRKFDEIVDFSGVETYLDTPVKRYSSGMYVRLAFAVAAHLEPEILLVDEVLAVGDAEFQKKCLGKMEDVAGEGRTVLLVSHNMSAVLNLCQKSIFLSSGIIKCIDITEKVVEKYLSTTKYSDNKFKVNLERRKGDQQILVENFYIEPRIPKTGSEVKFHIKIIRRDISDEKIISNFALTFLTSLGSKVLQIYSGHMMEGLHIPPGRSTISVTVDNFPLAPGTYKINIWVGSGNILHDWVPESLNVNVESGEINKGIYVDNRGYPVIIKSFWNMN